MRHSMRSAPQAQRLARPFCPKCDDMLYAPEASQHVNDHLVRHIWCCESCGHMFKTSVILERRNAEATCWAAA